LLEYFLVITYVAPKPINDETNDVDLSSSRAYKGEKKQVQIANQLSFELGLTIADSFSRTADFNYAINEGLSLYRFYTCEYFQNQQNC